MNQAWGGAAALLAFVRAFCHLFLAARFRAHRLLGLAYLVLFFLATADELAGRLVPAVYVVLPVCGCLQAVIASRTFTFLPPPNQKSQGFFHPTRAMSHDFVTENIYFSGLLLFQSCYLSFPSMRTNSLCLPLELIGVFFPYHTVRGLFPQTSFSHSTNDPDRFTRFYTRFVKFFYVIAKHFSGYFVNYLNFLGLFGGDPVRDWRLVRMLFLLAGWGTTISIFIQTLKFRKYIGKYTAAVLYAGSFPFFYLCYASLLVVAYEHAWLTALTLCGMAVNFGPRKAQIGWQALMCLGCLSIRFGGLPRPGAAAAA